MKIKINESDIKGMVFEGVKRAIFEHVNIADIIRKKEEEQKASGRGGKNPLFLALQAFQQVLPNSGDIIASSWDFAEGMQKAYDSASPEEQQELERAINQLFGYETIDMELDPDVSAAIQEAVDRVMAKKLNEVKQ